MKHVKPSFKVGDYVVCPKTHKGVLSGGPTCGWGGPSMDGLVNTVMRVTDITPLGRVLAKDWAWEPSWLRLATEQEVRDGCVKKEQRAKKPLLPGAFVLLTDLVERIEVIIGATDGCAGSWPNSARAIASSSEYKRAFKAVKKGTK